MISSRTVKEPIAITGMGMNFPGGAQSKAAFWKLMCDGTDAISEIPETRWDISRFYHPEAGINSRTYSKWGGFLNGVEHFDAAFFGLSETEAKGMDPQQRLLLETAWHAIEDAGEVVDRQTPQPIGVFIGACTNEHKNVSYSLAEPTDVTPYTATSGAMSIVSNRISHTLHLSGPSVSFDTACSSSLVALHYACHSLWNQECDRALVGGVNYITDPMTWVAFCGMGALSPEGRCKAFDAQANGFVRAEGAGVIMLKPLSQAQADGDRIYACIQATGTNQDGHTPAISMPDQTAQEQLIQQTLRNAGLDATDIDYIEAHGTGTPVGDPIEATAIGNSLGRPRPTDQPLLMGSVKTNIGHLEAGAGIAGLIKSALALWHRQVPPNLHFQSANPNINFSELNLRVPTKLTPLTSANPEQPIHACINSFGFGGTNAHAIIASVEPAPCTNEPGAPHTQRLTISAQTEAALKQSAEDLLQDLPADPVDFQHFAASTLQHRSPLKHSLLIQADSPQAVRQAIHHWQSDQPDETLVAATNRTPKHSGIVWVFNGQGSQWFDMGRELLQDHPACRASIERIRDEILKLGGFDLMAELERSETDSKIQNTNIAQPAIFAVQVALAEWWKSQGVQPTAIVGHSVGEVAAAYVSGMLTFEQAVRVIYYRGHTMQHAGGGKMLAVGITPEEASKLIAPYGDQLSLAASNSPVSVSISGDPAALNALAKDVQARDIFCREVPVEYAFHSAQMDPVQQPLLDALAELQPATPEIPLYSTVTGKRVTDETWDADYWWHNVRETVRFAEAIAQLMADGYSGFLEIGSHPVLRPSLSQCAKHAELAHPVVTYSQHKKETSRNSLFRALATLAGSGYQVDRRCWVHGNPTKTELPLYPFDRERIWDDWQSWTPSRLEPQSHPFLVSKIQDILPAWYFYPRAKLYPYLADHAFDHKVLIPAAAFVEMGLAIGQQVLNGERLIIEDLELKQALVLPEGRATPAIRIALNDNSGLLQIHSCATGDFQEWTLNAEAEVRRPARPARFDQSNFQSAQKRCTTPVDVAATYAVLRECGLQYGPTFQGVESMHSGEREAFAQVALPACATEAWESDYLIHPALLDAVFQTLLAALPQHGSNSKIAYLPSGIRRFRWEQAAGSHLQVHVHLKRYDDQEMEADFTLVTPAGDLVAVIEGFQCTKLNIASSQNPYGLPGQSYETRWHLAPTPADFVTSPPERFLPDLSTVAAAAAQQARNREQLLTTLDYKKYDEILKKISRYYVIRNFLNLGFDPPVGTGFTQDELMQQTGIASRHERQLQALLHHLTEAEIIQPVAAGTWRVLQSLSDAAAAVSFAELLERLPAFTNELNLLLAVGENSAEIMRDERDVLEVLFDAENNGLLERLYSNAMISQVFQDATGEAVRQLSSQLPVGRRLKILEIGGGTGATTMRYLPALPEGKYEITFTDVSEAFFNKAEQRFPPGAEIVYRKLDISQCPLSQDFGAEYDLVIAANVLHATPVLATTMEHVKSLIRPGGVLLMVEGILQHVRFADLIFGFTPDWWGYEDSEFRGDYPQITVPEWQQLLQAHGFSPPQVIEDTAESDYAQYGLFLAQLPEHSSAVPTDKTIPESQPKSYWAILSDETDTFSNDIQTALQNQGIGCRMFTSPSFAESWDTVLQTAQDENCLGLLYLRAGNAPAWSDALSSDDWEASLASTIYEPHALIQQLAALELDPLPVLAFVTRGGLSVLPGELPNGGQSMHQSILRVAANEVRQVVIQMFDLSAQPTDAEIEILADALCDIEADQVAAENQLAIRGEGRYLPRLEPAPPHPGTPLDAVPAHAAACRVTSSQFGVLDRLDVESATRRDPDAHEVEIQVHAAGLNFRDVMKALNIYPTTIGDARMLGDEFSGEVVKVGTDVTRFQPGDRVIGVSMDCFRSYWTGDATQICRLPDRMTYAEGATVLTAYSTAYHALHELGEIKPGERILIHSAAGGVGLAAVRMAQQAGAEVFATAGSQVKRDLLRHLGVEHVFDSRSLEFADDIMRVTQQEGIDLVLNSLAGAALEKSLSCLRAGGRFLEIGKRDIYGNSRIGLRPFKNQLTFSSIDLAMGLQGQGGSSSDRLQHIESMLEDGTLSALPHTIFPFTQPASAFRYMSQGRHVGKIVLNFASEHTRPRPQYQDEPPVFSSEQTAVITGGTQGMGLAMARWLMTRGTRHLLLLSRSGLKPDNTALHAFMQEAEQQGVTVVVHAVDVSDASALATTLNQVRASMPPISILLHSAFVLADNLFTEMTQEQWETSLRAKAFGAWNLHQLTRQDDIEQFIVFSSISSIFASPGQANYVAANTFVEDLMQYRRSCGLRGTSIKLDMILDTGSVARDEQLETMLSRLGMQGITSDEVTLSMDALLRNDVPAGAIIKTDLSTAIAGRPLFANQNRYSLLPQTESAESGENQGQQLRLSLPNLPAADRLAPTVEFLQAQVARVLRTSPASITPSAPLSDLGVDSLMAVELIGILESQLSLSIPTGKVAAAPTVNTLAVIIIETITGEKCSTTAESKTVVTPTSHQTDRHVPTFSAQQTPADDLQQLLAYQEKQEYVYSQPSRRQHILLTGANGFLGTYLLRHWLEHTDLEISCLVRANSEQVGRQRLLEAWESYQLDTGLLHENLDRCHICCGDLSEPHLGLTPETFEHLSQTIDTIYHSGAKVNHVADYYSLRSVNVVGMLELLRLAATGIAKRFHFASSVAVYTSNSSTKFESSVPENLAAISTGYGQTKAVCEHLLDQARAHGLETMTHRIGPVIGDRISGISAQHDVIWLLLKASARLGMAPQSDHPIGLIPVELASEIITAALMTDEALHRIHVINPETVTFDQMVDAIRNEGISIQSIPNQEWLQQAQSSQHLAELATYMLYHPELMQDLAHDSTFADLDTSVMQQVIQAAQISVQPMDAATLSHYARFLIRTGLQDLAPTAASSVQDS